MRFYRASFAFAVVSLSANAQPLARFLDEAAGQNVDGRLARVATASARASFDQQWSALLPSLSANGGYTRNQFAAIVDVPNGPMSTQRITIIPQDQLEATLKAELPLIDVSKWVRVGAASAQAGAAEAREEDALQQVRREVVTAYFGFAGARAVLGSAERSLAVAQAQLEQQRARRAAGVATELELVRAQAEVERTTQVQAEAFAQLENARRSLRSVSGLDPKGEVSLPEDDLHPEPPLVELEARVDALPQVVSAERDIDAASRTWTAAAVALAPSVNAQFTQRFTNATGFQNQAAVWNAGVAFSWRADVASLQGLRVASASEQTARLSREKVRQQVLDRLHADWQRVGSALKRVSASRAQVESAKKAQALAHERNAAGVATQLDVIQADRDLFSAEVNDVQARFDLALARASLHLSAGLPLENAP